MTTNTCPQCGAEIVLMWPPFDAHFELYCQQCGFEICFRKLTNTGCRMVLEVPGYTKIDEKGDMNRASRRHF